MGISRQAGSDYLQDIFSCNLKASCVSHDHTSDLKLCVSAHIVCELYSVVCLTLQVTASLFLNNYR